MHWDTFKQDNYSTVGGDGECKVGKVQASTTSPMRDNKGFELQWLPEIHPLHFQVDLQKFSTLRDNCKSRFHIGNHLCDLQVYLTTFCFVFSYSQIEPRLWHKFRWSLPQYSILMYVISGHNIHTQRPSATSSRCCHTTLAQ